MNIKKLKELNGKKLVFKDKSGYVLVYSPNNPFSKTHYVLEHRLVVEAFIGRLLTKNETIHHIDGNKSNNDINNLFLFKNQAEHKSFENKVKQFGMTNPIKRQIENRWKEYLN